MYLRILALALFTFLTVTHISVPALAQDLLERATYVRTDNPMLGPDDIWAVPDRAPYTTFKEGDAGKYVWIIAHLGRTDLRPNHNFLFTRGLRARQVDVFIHTEGSGWSGPYPEGKILTTATHPADTTIIHLPVTLGGEHHMALKLYDPSPDMGLRGLSLISAAQAAEKETSLTLLYQIILMVVAIAFAYNLFLYAIYRHKFQLYYIIYTASLMSYVAILSHIFGPVNELFDGRQHFELRTVLYSLTAMGVYLFAAEITRGEFPKHLTKALSVAAFLPLSVNVVEFLSPIYLGSFMGVLYDIFGTLGLIIFFIGAAIVIPRGGRNTQVVLIAFLVPAIGLAIKIFYGYTGNGPSFWIDNSVIIATAIENIIVALIIADRLLRLNHQERLDNTL